MANPENHGTNTDKAKPKTKRGQNPEFIAQKWKPGQSGNPNGRPKGVDIQALLIRGLNKPMYKGAKKTKLDQWVDHILADLLNGNSVVFKAVIDRLWPVIQQHMVDATVDLGAAKAELIASLERQEAAEEAADRELVQ